MNDLLRELAPISSKAWKEIEAEARRTLKLTLAARKLVDFVGPLGWETSSVDSGRVDAMQGAPGKGVAARTRRVLPLVELRAPFALSRDELEVAGRAGKDADLRPVTDAARHVATAENRMVFDGYQPGAITGIGEAAVHAKLALTDDYQRYPKVVGEALSVLRNAGVAGPYGIALSPRCYTGLTETTAAGGHRVFDHVRKLLDGPIVWAPGIDGAVVVSLRGGDFELTVGQDFSVGYLDHTNREVQLYLQESMTFRVLGAEAAVALSYEADGKDEQ